MFSGGFDDDVIFCCCHHDEELKKVPRPCIYGAQTLEMFSGGRNERARKHSALGVSKFSSVQACQQLQMYKRAGGPFFVIVEPCICVEPLQTLICLGVIH